MRSMILLLLLAGATWAKDVEGVVLSNDAWPRSTTLAEWTADVMRISGVEHASETAQARSFFEWLRLFSRMAVGGMIQAYEGPYGKEQYVIDAHKQLFVYGWGYCDTTSRIAEAAWQEYKHDARAAARVCVQHEGGGYHTMYRLRLDGKYAAFDPRYGYYLLDRDAPDARILDWAELNGQFEKNKTYKNRARPYFEIAGLEWERALLLHPTFFATEEDWHKAGSPIEHVFGDRKYQMGTRFHDVTFALKPGMTVERFWDNSAKKFYVPAGKHTQREWPFLPTGRFYRVTETSHNGNWPKYDPNYQKVRAYVASVPSNEGYPEEVAGGKTIGQAYGVLTYEPKISSAEQVIEIRSPFVLVDGTAMLNGGDAEMAIRAMSPKANNVSDPDTWSAWQTLPKARTIALGRERFNGRDVSIHGVYRFELRVRGNAKSVALKLYFENGIMSIPPLFAGSNNMRFRVADASALDHAVTLTYKYDTSKGPQQARKTLAKADFHNNEAQFQVNAPGLTRCRSVTIAY